MKRYVVAIGIVASYLTLNLETAHALDKGGLFIEPGVTYEQGDGDLDLPSPFTDSDADVNGFGLMGRFGFHISEAFFVAADGRYSKPQVKNDDYKADAEAYNYGVTAGLQMPTTLGIRVWGTWVAGGQMDPDKDENLDLKYQDANGYRIGAGVKLSIVSLNLEYQSLTYKDAELQEIGPFAVGQNLNSTEAKNDSWILSVSFPFAL
jgi:hypothetical protein